MMFELAFLRNNLYNRRWGPEDFELLGDIRAQVKHTDSPFTGLVLNAIENALVDIGAGRLEQAARELNYVHNLDLENGFAREWDERWFLGTYTSTYLSEVEDLDRVKRLLRLLGQAVAALEKDKKYQTQKASQLRFEHGKRVQLSAPVLFVGGHPDQPLEDRDVFTLSRYSGETVWTVAIAWQGPQGRYIGYTVWDDADVAFAGRANEVYGFDLRSGQVVYHQALSNHFVRFLVAPDQKTMFIFDGHDIRALKPDLHERWCTRVANDGSELDSLEDGRLTVNATMAECVWDEVVLDVETGQELSRSRDT